MMFCEYVGSIQCVGIDVYDGIVFCYLFGMYILMICCKGGCGWVDVYFYIEFWSWMIISC